MRVLLPAIVALVYFTQVNAQSSIVTASNLRRRVPVVGHMLNYLTKPSWSNTSFIDSVKALNLGLIRYPGGTESQYFDWRTGRSVSAMLWTDGTLSSYRYIGTTPHVSYPLSELLYFYRQTSVKPIFCLNLLTKSLEDQVAMLLTAESIGLPVEYIELGNELYFTEQDFIRRYPNPIDYILDVQRNWLPRLKSLFPGSKIAVIGAYDGATTVNGAAVPPRITTWNDSLLARNPSSNAITFHYYIPPNTTTLSNPNTMHALAAPFRHWPTLKTHTVDNVTNGMECWVTEYNLTDGNQTTYSIASSWVHALFTASFFSLMLEEPKITMLLNHQITGSAAFASLASYTPFGDTITNRLTAEGNAMRLIHRAVMGNDSATKLLFSNNIPITVGPTVYPTLLGWRFSGNNSDEMVILNLGSADIDLDLSAIINGEYEFEMITATEPLRKDVTTQDLLISKGLSSGTLRTASYSLTYVRSIPVTGVNRRDDGQLRAIYPNPASSVLKLDDAELPARYTIADIFGRTAMEGITDGTLDVSTLTSGTYVLSLRFGSLTRSVRFVKE